MSRTIKSAVVPFKMKKTKKLVEIIDRLVKEAGKSQEQEATENGWTYNFDIADDYRDKNKNKLYCDTIEKGDLKLFVVNEHEYSDIGLEDYAIFSTSIKTINEFCKAFGIKNTPTKNDVVSQTI